VPSSLSLFKNTSFRRACGLVLILLLVVILPPISQALLRPATTPEAKATNSRLDFVPGEILIRFRRDAISKGVDETISKGGKMMLAPLSGAGREIPIQIERVDGAEIVEGLRLARVAPADTLNAIEALNARADVLYAEPNYIRRPDATPNDPQFSNLWGLKNTGQSQGTAGADIDAEAAWNTTTGSRNVVVGIIDEGVDINHPDLSENIWRNASEVPGNNSDDDGNGFVDDVNGYDFFHNDASVYDGQPTDDETDAHGTHVAGTIGATGNNGQGVVGVNWQVSLMSLKVLGRIEEGPASSNVLVTVRAYNYAKMMRDLWASTNGARGANIRVLNNSYGGRGRSQAELDAIRALGQSGILFVTSAGNEAKDNDRFPHYPSNYNASNLISVAATDRFERISSFSNYGPRKVQVAAPGEEILSTTPHGTYAYASGTSMAAPHVSGAAALICAQHPNISLQQLRAALIYTGDEVPSLNPTIFPPGVITGRRLNVANALQSLVENDSVAPASVGNFRITEQNGRSITLAWNAPGDDGNTGRASLYELRFADNDLSTAAQFEQATPLVAPLPATAGTAQTITVKIPFRHANVTVGIRALDNAGNPSPVTTLNVSVAQSAADPYIMTESSATPLSTGGTPLGLIGDDKLKTYFLPFNVPFFEGGAGVVTVSSNGALYFDASPPRHENGDGDDAVSSLEWLNSYGMIAGLWDDLRTDRRPGDDVYVVTPDPDRIIFRWQAVTYDTPLGAGTTRGEHPVNFEIELRRDGTFIIRYGDGNQVLLPVVGISNGEPEAYVSATHTSEEITNLTNAQTVTFTRRVPPPQPKADLSISMSGAPNPVATGQQIAYTIDYVNLGPNGIQSLNITDQLPAGTAFVSCSGPGTCTGPPVGQNGTVTINANAASTGTRMTFNIVLKATAAPGTNITNTVTVSTPNNVIDPNPSNNSASVTTEVYADTVFSNVAALAAGDYHTVSLKRDGTVWSWGSNSWGQLGDGNFSTNTTPVQAFNLTGVTAIAGGGKHTLALRGDGTVWAWGMSAFGQLGDGQPFSTIMGLPVQVVGLTGVTAVSAGEHYSVALRNDGTVWTWGYNDNGQLGDGTTTERRAPVQVSGLNNVTAISAGQEAHTVVVKADGTVWAWGENRFGELGPGTTNSMETTPVQVSGLTNVKTVAAGEHFTVALKLDGTVWSWGDRNPVPAQVGGLTSIVSLDAGYDHGIALKSDGTVWTWGYNVYGELGDGTNGTRANAMQVSGLSGVTAVAAGEHHSAALLSDGTVRTWGINQFGQLGDGTKSDKNLPVQVSGVLVVSDPFFNSPGGFYTSPVSVRITSATEGAVIHYTTNGNDPLESDPTISSGASLLIDKSLTLKVKAWKSGWVPSGVKSISFTIAAATIQLGQTSIILSEWEGRIPLNVMRNDASTAATVDYATSDTAGLTPCNTVSGVASSRCDYATSVGTIRFAVGETSKTIFIPLVDDAYSEGTESFKVSLSNPSGAILGANTTATISIIDNETANGTNPVNESSFFVREHYIDFLGREPDPAGLAGWQSILNGCPASGKDANGNYCDRIEVSAGFFRSPEFQDRGYLIYRFYSAVGKIPLYEGFMPDFAKVSGFLSAQELEANKVAFVNEFMTRPDFQTKYGALTDPTAYVDALLQTVGLPTHPSRQTWITGLTNGSLTRGQVLRALVESTEVYQKYYTEAFVIMQYFGYLRRSADISYLQWIQTMNSNGGDYRVMINGFLNSAEYRQRFGP
jgi:uncharacterized repeat protein (TIGR01451 family)